jgi:crotonobetainyl-CoA:carnitine CoA-transferase CaiB-like acyl-CoA transferase
MDLPDLPADPRFCSNPLRVKNRAEIIPIIADKMASETTDYWVDRFTGGG